MLFNSFVFLLAFLPLALALHWGAERFAPSLRLPVLVVLSFAFYGYMESPNVPKGLAILRKQGFKFDIMSTSFFLSRRSIKPSPQSGMPIWQDNLYIGLTKSATDATNFFQIPTGRVVEVGTQVTV